MRPVRSRFADAGRVAVGVRLREALRHATRVRLVLVPAVPALDGRDDVQALAARRLHEALEPVVAERRAEVARGVDRALPGEPDVGIDVEHQLVRALHLVGVRDPRVDLERAELRQRDEAGEVVHGHVGLALPALLLDRHARDDLRHAGRRVLLEEALVRAAVGAAHERERRGPRDRGSMRSATTA